MKTQIAIITLLLSLAVPLFADDGGSYYPEEWTYGNIYVKEPNDKIALENELLFFGPDKAEAVFDFVNTTAEKVKVPCSFPVVMKVPFKTYKGKARPSYSQWTGTIDSVIWEIALGRHIGDPDRGRWLDTLSIDELLTKDKSLLVKKYAEYLSELDSYGVVEREYDEKGKRISARRYGDHLKKAYSGCDITLDGKKIPIQNVGIEVNVEINPKSEVPEEGWNYDTNDEFSYLTVVLHFYHELEFLPSRHARLEVSYSVNSERRSNRRSVYEGFYDISTGGTWKGSMKRFLVASEMDMVVRNGSTKPKEFSDILNFYLFENYKPSSGEYFVFNSKNDWDEVDAPPYERDFPKQDFVSGITSSSFLKGSFKYYSMVNWGNSGNLKTSDYKPERSFDSDPYNGWVEGAKGDGRGEWIGFTLSKKAFGPFATNGLARFKYQDDGDFYDSDSPFYGKNRLGTWLENNRIKTMKLTGTNGTKAALNFRDFYAGGIHAPGMPGGLNRRYYFNAVENPVILPPGSYRMEIAEVYKGTKYDDTALGEVWFHELSDGLSAFLESEEKSGSTFFTGLITDLLRSRLVRFDIAEYFMKQTFYSEK